MEAEPEIAVVTVTVEARDRDRRTVLDRLVSRNREVLDLVKGYGEAVEKLESGPVTAYPEVKPKGQSKKFAKRSPAGRHGDEVPSLDLEPVRQPVTANIDARFAMILPGPSPQ